MAKCMGCWLKLHKDGLSGYPAVPTGFWEWFIDLNQKVEVACHISAVTEGCRVNVFPILTVKAWSAKKFGTISSRGR